MATDKRVVVFHRGYGCDTGCCGHALKIPDSTDVNEQRELKDSFAFSHPFAPPEKFREWAEEFLDGYFGKGHSYDLDWEHCVIVDD